MQDTPRKNNRQENSATKLSLSNPPETTNLDEGKSACHTSIAKQAITNPA